jgi:fructose-specific phosphotransferase system IIC component
MKFDDQYLFISALIYALIIISFLVHSLITKKLTQEETFTYVCVILISPVLGMFISILIFPAIVIGILWLISKGIHSLKNKQQ